MPSLTNLRKHSVQPNVWAEGRGIRIFLKDKHRSSTYAGHFKSTTQLRRAEVACHRDGKGEEHLQKFCVQTS